MFSSGGADPNHFQNNTLEPSPPPHPKYQTILPRITPEPFESQNERVHPKMPNFRFRFSVRIFGLFWLYSCVLIKNARLISDWTRNWRFRSVRPYFLSVRGFRYSPFFCYLFSGFSSRISIFCFHFFDGFPLVLIRSFLKAIFICMLVFNRFVLINAFSLLN